MSKEQWGHGYYSGLADGITGGSIDRINKDNIEKLAENIIRTLESYQKWRVNRDPIPLADIKSILSGYANIMISDYETRLIVEYIWENEPRGAYISGRSGKTLDYKNDYLIV